jgi:hypothetical protein
MFQILLIGDESPQKQKVNDAFENFLFGFSPQDLPFIAVKDFDCAIYVESSPDLESIDQLREAAIPLILVASTDSRSDLFVSIASLDDPKTAAAVIENIKNFIRPIAAKPPVSMLGTYLNVMFADNSVSKTLRMKIPETC